MNSKEMLLFKSCKLSRITNPCSNVGDWLLRRNARRVDSSHKNDDFRLNIIMKDLQLNLALNTSDS